MKRILSFLSLLMLVAAVSAQTPDIRFKTKIYEKDGAQNMFTLVLGAAPGKTGKAEIVCSGGNKIKTEIVAAHYDAESMALLGTNIACQVNQEGVVEVFCDEGVEIDYLSCTGAEITNIEFKNPERMVVLALEHNILEELDLAPFTNLQALYLNDNPFNVKPLADSGLKPNLQILEIALIENIAPDFDIVKYPNLQAFDAMSTHGLKKLTPAACPQLQKISIDNTNVENLDVRSNQNLYILNVSETRIRNIDVSQNRKLQQLYATHSSAWNTDIKLSEIDVTNNPDLIYLFLNDNNLTSIDISKCPMLRDLYVRNNYLTSIDISNNPALTNVFISGNYMDFNSLPVPQETWADYDIRQRPLNVPTSFLVGSSIDLSKQLVRSDSETFATLYCVSEHNPDILLKVDASRFSFKDGVLTINEVIADSVYASFTNSTFPNIALTTNRFLVKEESTFGKPDLVATVGNSLTAGQEVRFHVGVYGATKENPKTVLVDLGDGQLAEFKAVSAKTPIEANIVAEKPKFGMIKVYLPEGERLTAFKIADFKLTSLDLSRSPQLTELTLSDTNLRKLDLSWNRCLESIEITGNNFGADFTLAGANGYYEKNVLSHVALSNNKMTDVHLNGPGSWLHIDLSHNQLSSLNFTDADHVQYLDLSHNDFEYLKINYLGELKTFYCNDNHLNELVLPENNVIETFNCANNCFTLKDIPARNGLDEEHFIYAPQADIQIPSKGPGYNLSDQFVTINGAETVFTWKTTDGETLVEGKDYTCNGGITRFNDCTIGKMLYCELSHPEYPAFSGKDVLKTSAMYSAGMPTHLLATFTTPVGGQTASLSFASHTPNNSLFIDWTGTNSLEQYPLATTYTRFSAKTTKDAKVKVWSYDEDDNISVFSMTGVKISDHDFSPLRNLKAFALNGAGISQLKMPQSPNLAELFLTDNNFSSFDFSALKHLNSLSFSGNNFTTVDLSALPLLESVSFDKNRLESISFGNNSRLWHLGLSNNRLTEIDLSQLPSLYQVFLNYNQLSNIDLSQLKELRVVYLDHNRFDFSTLPVPTQQWTVYLYGDQADLQIECKDGKVDLSRLAERDGVETNFIWFYGRPTLDEEQGALVGEELYIDKEYTVQKGVTTFLADIDKACCLLTNDLFPNTYMLTNQIAATAASGIQLPETSTAKPQSPTYNIQGQRVTPDYKDIVIRNGRKLLLR